MSSAKIYKYEICRYRQIFSTTIKNLLCLFVCIVNKTRFLGLIFLLPPQLSFLRNLLKLIVFYTSSKLTVFVINISLNHNLHKCCINPSLLYNLWSTVHNHCTTVLSSFLPLLSCHKVLKQSRHPVSCDNALKWYCKWKIVFGMLLIIYLLKLADFVLVNQN